MKIDRQFPTPRPRPTPNPRPMPHPMLPTGVLNFTNAGTTTIPSSILNNPNIDGIRVCDKWWRVEPTEGIYDFSRLDFILAQIPSTKWILLSVAIGGFDHDPPTLDSIPHWVYQAIPPGELMSWIDNNPNHTTYGQPVSVPVPWSQTWLDKKTALIAALGARYASNPQIKAVESAVVTGANMDWSMPSGDVVDGILPTGSTTNSRILAAGYTHAKMVSAGATMMDAFARAFRNQYVYLAVGIIPSAFETDIQSVAREIRDAARTKWGALKIIIGSDGVSNTWTMAPPVPTGNKLEIIYESNPVSTSGQALWNVFGDTTYRMNGGVAGDPIQILEGTVDKYFSYGGKGWLEIYQADCVEPTMAPAIEYAHTKLTG